MATTATMATTMMLWIKESGKEAVQTSAKPSDTVASLKTAAVTAERQLANQMPAFGALQNSGAVWRG